VFCSARTVSCRIAAGLDTRRLILLLAVAALASCSRPQRGALQRLAVLRFENLGSDTSTDWMGRAFSEIISGELASAPQTYTISSSRLHSLGQTLGGRPIAAPGISAEAPLALAAGANRLAYGDYWIEGGRIHARMVIEDPQTRRIRVLDAVSIPGPDVASAATELARQVWPQAPAYSAHNLAAVEAYAKAIEAQDAGASEQAVRESIADDPDFGAPYLLLAELQAQQRNRAGLVDTLERANRRGISLPQIDRARLETISAGLTGDIAARQQALDVLVHLTPYDPGTWRSAAEIANQRHQYPQAVQAYEHALTVEPEDATSWNQLAYSAAFAGNLPTAMAALRRYQTLRPGDPNPLDSMGDVNLMAGRLKEAEEFYLQAAKMSPAFLNGGDQYKAAFAHLLTGDVAGADALFQQYRGTAAHQAEWLWMAGRRKQGYDMLAAQAAGLPREAQAVAYAELAFWSLLLDNSGAASAMAQKAVETMGPASATGVALARFLAAPPLSPDGWQARAQQFFPDAGASPGAGAALRDVALGYAFLLTRQFPAAVPVLRRVYDRSGAAPESSAAIELGWALVESGAAQEVATLLRTNPAPSPNGPGPLLAMWFPQIFRARALAAEKLGKGDEARANQGLFEKLSGR
jgi:tetratricopeptide (TPR) repeat protein